MAEKQQVVWREAGHPAGDRLVDDVEVEIDTELVKKLLKKELEQSAGLHRSAV